MEKAEKDRKKKLSIRFVPTRRGIENSKKIEKKFRKLKNTIVASFQAIICRKTQKIHKKLQKNSKNKKNTVMASFQAKFGWKRLRKRENTNYRFVSFLPNG